MFDDRIHKKIEFYKQYSQLWDEEPFILLEYVNKLPNDSIIVEIGTAEGGTAGMLYEVTKEKNIQIYTIDISPSITSFEILKATTVNIITMESHEFSKIWMQVVKKPIDLLIIDGDHSFEGIYNDLYSWLPHLKKQADIIFHDYDPPERGGVAHFGVQVFLDTIINKNVLFNWHHQYRYLFGCIKDIANTAIQIDDFVNTFLTIGNKITTYNQMLTCKTESVGDIISNCDLSMNTLQVCYFLIPTIINHETDSLLEITHDKSESLRWLEMYNNLVYGYGDTFYPAQIEKLIIPNDVGSLSRCISCEQIKLNILRKLLGTLVGWDP